MNYIGIDISKASFDVAIEKAGRYRYYRFGNDTQGFKSLITLLNRDTDQCVMEASGAYYQRLAVYLTTQEVGVSVVNPLVVRRFCQMRLTRAKTDKKDAMMLAEYGKAEHPDLWQAPEGFLLEMKQLQAYLSQLDKNRAGYLRQMEAFRQSPSRSESVEKGIHKMLQTLDREMERIEAQMEEIISSHYGQLYERIQSIPGIGKKTGRELIVISGGFTKFDNAKQLSSYVGFSPRLYESGSSVRGKVRMCKMGMSRVRAMLYVCTWSAIRCNAPCRALYNRLVEKGKAKQVALIAVANKLLKQVFAVATKKEFYNENLSFAPCL